MSWKFYTSTQIYDAEPHGVRIDGVAIRNKEMTYFSVTEGTVEGGETKKFVLRIFLPTTKIACDLERYLSRTLEKLNPKIFEIGSFPVFGPQIYGYPYYVTRMDYEFPINERMHIIKRLAEIFGGNV